MPHYQQIEVTELNAINAATLLGQHTNGTFDIWNLSGDNKSKYRREIMTVLTTRIMALSNCSVVALRDAFYSFVRPEGATIVARETSFENWCKKVTA